MEEDLRARLNNKLSPAEMSLALIRAGALLTGHELVKAAIVDDVRYLFTVGMDDDSGQQKTYQAAVLTLGSNKLEASIAWLVQNYAIAVHHVETLNALRDHRNDIAHSLARLLIDPDDEVEAGLLLELNELFVALDRFWAPFHIGANPDFDSQYVDVDSFFSGPRLVFGLVLELAQVKTP